MDSPYWTTREVRSHFLISRQTLDRWRKTLGFPEPVHNVGHPRGPCRYDRAECLAWDERRRRARSTKRLPDPSEGLQQDAAD